MNIFDYLRLAWDQLKRRVVVTALCTMGIAIGSASIVVALSFGESINHYSRVQMSQFMKTDEITIHRGNPTSGTSSGDPNETKAYELTKSKIDIMRTFPNVKAIATYQTLNSLQFEVDHKSGYINNLFATELDTLSAFGFEFQQGGPADQENAIILSYGATMGLFDEQLSRSNQQAMRNNSDSDGGSYERNGQMRLIAYPLYQKQVILKPNLFVPGGMTSSNIQFPLRVIGILKKPEGMSDQAASNMKTAFVSPSLGKKLQEAINNASSGNSNTNGSNQEQQPSPEFNEVKIKVTNSTHVKEIEEGIKKLKLSSQTNLHYEEQMQGQLVILRFIFGGVGLFILFVASISIIVAMTMSTHQRRRQIGIMKVLGANLNQIRNMFIAESAMLGLLGGACGILLSYWVIWGINLAVIQFSPSQSGSDLEILFISPWILPVGLFFAVMTGVLSGIYPAIKASRTDALTAIKRD
ncbi:MacB-like core domain-containing protein [Paenibacillus sp. 1_12]|uniref:ABC transporter permease n=1 Tax=Paenibacillus sp. 1_12 TaxID=1566278 RepID=UPI0008F24B44|nr:ABC transporter permease [Paenibacillus sp. 1_12]SFL26856.1 MacB-like core domain-containing protein [Paenibacillus sp. 1_12]